MAMNIDAKPWYPTVDSAMSEMDVFASLPPHDSADMMMLENTSSGASCTHTPDPSPHHCVRRNDPYRSTSFLLAASAQEGGAASGPYTSALLSPQSSGSPNHHNGGASAGTKSYSGAVGTTSCANRAHIMDYSELMYTAMQQQGLLDGPPSYTDFVAQPYRSVQFRAAQSSSHDLDGEHHGVSSGSNSGSNRSNSPRQGASSGTQQQQVAEKKPKAPAVPVAIPLPRSRRTGSDATAPVPASPVAAGPPKSNSTTPTESQNASPTKPSMADFPLPAPRSQRAQTTAPSTCDDFDDDAEKSIVAKLQDMLSRTRNATSFSLHATNEQVAHASHHNAGDSTHPVVRGECAPASPTSEVEKDFSKKDTTQPAAAAAAAKKKKTAVKKTNEWKTVEKHGNTTASGANSNCTSHNRNASTPLLTTASANKFELVSQQGKGAHHGGKKSSSKRREDSEDSDDDTAIVFASNKPQRHHAHAHKGHAHHNADEEDAWLEEVARAGAAAQEQHRRQTLEHTCYKDSLVFLGFFTLKSIPNVGALLPKKPTQAQISLASTLQRILDEPSTEYNNNAKHSALRRLLDKALSQPQVAGSSMAPLIACVHVELSECALDIESGMAHIRQAIQFARSQNSLPLELLALMAQARFNQKLPEMTETNSDLQRALDLALELHEMHALGWAASMVSVALETGGAFPESVSWQVLAWRIGHFVGDRRLEVEAAAHVGISVGASGSFNDAERLLNVVEELNKQIPRSAMHRSTLNMSQIANQIGDLERGLSFLVEERDAHIAMREPVPTTLSQNIALALRGMGRFEEALQAYQGDQVSEMMLCANRDVESLMGIATCLKLLGHTAKARDTMLKLLRAAREARDAGMSAKTLADIGDLDAKEGNYEDAIVRLTEGLRLVDQEPPNDCKQFFVKVHLCEAEWKISEVLETIHADRGAVVEAVRYSDTMRIPNTANIVGLLQKKHQRALQLAGISCAPATNEPTAADKETSVVVKKSAGHTPANGPGPRALAHFQASVQFLKTRFFDPAHLTRMLADKAVSNIDAMVVYSLHWNDSFDFNIYCLRHDDASGELVTNCVPLSFSPQAIRVLAGTHSAFYSAFHRGHHDSTEEDRSTNADGVRGTPSTIDGDTPLFPSHYWYAQNNYAKLHPEDAKRIEHDLDYCFSILYDALVKPIEGLLQLSATTPPRVMFIGDGVITMVPFPALRRQSTDAATAERLVDVCMSAKLPSVEHALGIYAKRLAVAATSQGITPEVAHEVPTVISGFTESDDGISLLRAAMKSVKLISILDGPNAVAQYAARPTAPTHREIEECSEADIPLLCKRLAETTLTVHPRDKSLSNELFRALFVDANRNAPLFLDMPVVTDVKEDYSGVMTTAIGTTLVSSSEIAMTWDLSSFPVVIATRFGAHGTRSVHETGIPVNRALLLAGAQRLLLPIGSNVLTSASLAVMSVPSAAALAVDEGRSVFVAVHEAMKELKNSGASTGTWCAFAYFGLP